MAAQFQLPSDSIIQVWLSGHEELHRAISLGLNVLYSSCWYLNMIEHGVQWPKYYKCDPVENDSGNTLSPKNMHMGQKTEKLLYARSTVRLQ